ncbi:unnamed protein product [Nippostrongylus brasiliensis]|uniref:Uncharacterized protein n=1 Tax=Nippostrongylus brasiliensis TaxID=27835 RepID=A0A0N4YTQ8_NIPBR|nr:unnamed protein product [Nippostrongylus brasiliensis]
MLRLIRLSDCGEHRESRRCNCCHHVSDGETFGSRTVFSDSVERGEHKPQQQQQPEDLEEVSNIRDIA